MKNKGFTLVELMVALVIISIIVGISILPLLSFLAKNRTRQNIIAVEQLLDDARTRARTKSKNISVVFFDNKADIIDPDGNLVNNFQFEDRIRYDDLNSSIAGNTITFNHFGSPIGSDGKAHSFTEAEGKIALCYYDAASDKCLYSKAITILPVTGIVKQ